MRLSSVVQISLETDGSASFSQENATVTLTHSRTHHLARLLLRRIFLWLQSVAKFDLDFVKPGAIWWDEPR